MKKKLLTALVLMTCAALAEEDCTDVQTKLASLGYYAGEIDGIWNEATETAVSNFQIANGLPRSGKADAETEARLINGVSCRAHLEHLAEANAQKQTIAFGAKGESVKQLQQELGALGFFDGRVDGVFGAETQGAVIRFQRAQGLSATGQADSVTLTRLRSGSPVTMKQLLEANCAKEGDTGEVVTSIQQRLRAFGCYDGAPSGVYGTATAAAVTAFQSMKNLPQSGNVDRATAKALFLEAAAAAPVTVTNEQIEKRLWELGYFTETPDNRYTGATEASLKLFQLVNALPVTGILDADTAKMMDTASSVTVKHDDLRSAVRKADAEQLKMALTIAGARLGQVFEGNEKESVEGLSFVQAVCAEAGLPAVDADEVRLLANMGHDGHPVFFTLKGLDTVGFDAGEGRVICAVGGYVLEGKPEDIEKALA